MTASITKNDGVWFSRKLKLKNSDFKIDVLFDKDRMFTDDLKYGKQQEIVFDNDKQCFTIKNLYTLREKWYLKHGISVKDMDNSISNFLKEV